MNKPSKVAEQAERIPISIASVLRSADFQRGVAEYRARKKPDFENTSDQYELGRQFAAIAPRDLPITTSSGRLNTKAVTIYRRHVG
jgi:hypothetical protein